MRRRLLVILPGLTTVLGLAIPAHAESGAVKDVFIEDFQGTTALDDPAFTDRLGYEGQVYEDRVGVYNLTIHTSGSMASVTHVEGDVTATSVIRPPARERRLSTRHLPEARHRQLPDQWRRRPAPGRVLLPARDRHRRRRLPQIRFTSRGHFVLDSSPARSAATPSAPAAWAERSSVGCGGRSISKVTPCGCHLRA